MTVRQRFAWAAAVAVLLALLGFVATASRPDDAVPLAPSIGQTVACKQAMREQLRAAIESGAEGTRPPACAGLDDETLRRLAGEVMSEGITR